ncbi:MAG: uroporphyrinogen-III C-methyltransferase [Candidatus Hydrothermarchaeales archaeon]
MTRGKVYLVGGGPGNPGLITVKGLELVKRADIIIYDRLVSEEIINQARGDAELIYVGKRTGSHAFKQDEINELLVKKATEEPDKVIVRLKGGDPLVFGRGGEEIRALKKAGLEFELVPGVTSAIAVPSLANIPLTDREYASSFTVVTGHEDPGKGERMDYGKLNADTIVVLMGVGNLPVIVEQLLKTRDKSTPVAIIQEGAKEGQRVIIGDLGTIVEKSQKEQVKPPAIVVIGDVVRLRKEFSK